MAGSVAVISVETGSAAGGHSTGYRWRTSLLITPVSVRTDTTRTTPSEPLGCVATIRPKRQSRRGVPGSSMWTTVLTGTRCAVDGPESGRRSSSIYSFTKTRLKLSKIFSRYRAYTLGEAALHSEQTLLGTEIGGTMQGRLPLSN